jgi:putative transposase
MPKYKLSLEERQAEKARREQLTTLMSQFNINELGDFRGLFKEMVGVFLESGLEGELDDELGYSKYDYRNKETANSRNGHSRKSLRTSNGELEIKVPRDRDGDFEPQLVKKHQGSLTREIEDKILSLYAKGMTQSDIEGHIREIYGIDCSESTISRATDKIIPVVREWQGRPLEAVYAVVFMDAIHFHVRSEGSVIKKAVYVAIGISPAGKKDVLGMWVGENESAKFWATVLNSLKNRGVQDILIACVDGLTGFTNAIESVYPKTEVQNCIIHQIRNSTKFVSYKDIKALMADLKRVYGAVDEQTALSELEKFEGIWGKKYPKIADGWRGNWANLSTYFKYPQEVRTLIYTTNAIEGFNRQLRKVTKSKGVFPTDDSLLKMLYLATVDITKKWKGSRKDWYQIRAQLDIFFPDRLP